YRNVRCVVTETRCADERYLAPWSQLRRCDVAPVFAAVSSAPDQAIVRACPQRVYVMKRWRERVNGSPLFVGLWSQRSLIANAGRNPRILARQVAADLLP